MSIICDHVNFTYSRGTADEIQALKDISFSIGDGEFVGIIGATGSGKSTLIQHLNGLLKATSGHIYINGEDIYDRDYSLKELRNKVGLVFQYPEHQLFEETVLRDVCFGPKNQGLSNTEAEMRAYEALQSVNLMEDCYDVSPFDLSGGQKRRAAIAGVLAMKPEILILDEPTAGLDPEGREEILNLLKTLHDEQNITVMLVSHSMEDMADYAERLLVMDKGRIIMNGNPRDVFLNAELLEKTGLSVPQVTYILRELRQKGFDVDISATTVDEAADSIMRALGL
ncbi:MAG: energy-coupling factor transporter ATPase [Lachnospiraceae bacterium]|nr:energy-coupling factor transporter ATPase [Lachnospiraceae bacterium]